jgi:hypothetical protein
MPTIYPVIRISIYPLDGRGPYLFQKTGDPNDDITSITVEATKQNPKGSFTIDMVQRPRVDNLPWHRVLRANDTVIIEAKRGGSTGELGKLRTIMIGLVDRTSAVEVVDAEGNLSFVSRIAGSDFGKLLRTQYIHFFKYFSLLDQLGIFSGSIRQDHFQGKRPAEFLRTYWDGLSQDGLADRVWDFELNTPQGFKRPIELFNTNFDSFEAEVPYDWTIYDREGDLWKLFQQIAEPPFHELFLRLGDPGQGIFGTDQVNPLFVLRKTSFNGSGITIEDGFFDSAGNLVSFQPPEGSDSDALTEQKELEQGSSAEQERGQGKFVFDDNDAAPIAADAYENNLSRGDSELFTVFSVKSHLFHQNEAIADLVMPVILNQDLYKKFGYREFTSSTRLIPDSMENIQDFARILTRKLADWFQFNLLFWSGSKTYGLRPDIRVGAELIDKAARGGEFRAHIEGYKHQWLVGGPATTTITISRGVFADEELDLGAWTLLSLIPEGDEPGETKKTARLKAMNNPGQ